VAVQRGKLIDLGAERLADALLELAQTSGEAENLAERLVATPADSLRRFKTKLASLKRGRRSIDWRGARNFARELEGLLEDLRAGVPDPEAGLNLVVSFYEADEAVFESCDDSSGTLGDLFRSPARDLFAEYAAACPDKERLMERLTALYAGDGYGVRGYLLEAADRFLDQERLQALARAFLKRAEKETPDSYQASHWLVGAKILARAARDASLFETACRAANPELIGTACEEIAAMHLEAGDATTALAWLDRAPPASVYGDNDRQRLRLKICAKLGRHDDVMKAAWSLFRAHRSRDSLAALLEVIGNEQRDAVIAAEATRILDAATLSHADAAFLVDMGRLDEAEEYLQKRAAALNGDLYTLLLPLAKAMEEHGRPLTASLIYRALIDSVLRKAQSKYYPHAVRYLKKLAALAPTVADWRGFSPQAEYEAGLRQEHGRKSAFWSRYSP